MIRGLAARQPAPRRLTRLLAAVLVAAAGTVAQASSGIDLYCDRDASTAPALLAAHTEPALSERPDDALPVQALADTGAETDESDNADGADEVARRSADTPVIRSRLPGVSETTLPSFRRQMHRTDI